MIVTKKQELAILQNCFFTIDPHTRLLTPKVFAFKDLRPAAGAFRKLEKAAGEDGVFKDMEIDFTPDQATILQRIFEEEVGSEQEAGRLAIVPNQEAIFELIDIFQGRDKSEALDRDIAKAVTTPELDTEPETSDSPLLNKLNN